MKTSTKIFGPIYALAIKDLRHLLRDRGAAFFALAFPLLIAVFFGAIFGGSAPRAGLSLVVVNEDGSDAATALVADLAADKSLQMRIVPDAATGEREVRLGRAIACVIIPRGFGEQAANMFTGGAMAIQAVVDPTKNSEAGLLTGKLNELAFKQFSRVLSNRTELNDAVDRARSSIMGDAALSFTNKALFATMFEAVKNVSNSRAGPPAAAAQAQQQSAPESPASQERNPVQPSPQVTSDPLSGWAPVNVIVRPLTNPLAQPRSGYELSLTQGIVWGLMGAVTAFGTSLASERTRGTLTRLIIGPITRGQVLAGKALACFIACLAIQAMLIAFGILAFRVNVQSFPMLLVAAFASALGFTGVMLFIAGITRSEGGGSGLGRALILVLAMIGGGTVPLFILPTTMQAVSKISPFTWATSCYEGAIWRGFGPAEMALPALVLVLFGVVGFAIGTSMLKWGD